MIEVTDEPAGTMRRMYHATCLCGWTASTSIRDLIEDRVRRHRKRCGKS